MEHPDPEMRRRQSELLTACPENERAYHAAVFRTANAAYRYHQKASQLEPSLEDYHHWLQGLPKPMRESMASDGFEKCRTYLPFTRHVMELRNQGMDAWMRVHLSEKDYKFWKDSHFDE